MTSGRSPRRTSASSSSLCARSLATYTFKDIWCGTNPNPIADPDALVPLLRRAL
ncbi:hypothetical protein GS484_07810 [Rhodococcus hoagii]|nr:hypothetical protein [Prescottella equi]